jgi:hypothetical protein
MNIRFFFPIAVAVVFGPSPSKAAVIFTESFGTVSATTTVADHQTANGFDNDSLTFSGTADVRATSVSTGYTGASGSANIFLATSGTASFSISGISTAGYQAGTVGLSFGAFKSTNASNMTTLVLEFSTDGTAWTGIGIPAQPTGSGTANWRLLSFTSTAIPISSSLALRWTSTDTGTSFRIDDVQLTAIPEPTATALGALGLLGLLRRRR